MIGNCGDKFNTYHMNRYRKMSTKELIQEYDAIEEVLQLDCIDNIFFIDELLSCESLIADRCIEIVKEKLIAI